MNSVPKGQKVVIGADFTGHVGKGNSGEEEVMGRYGVKERNEEGQRIMDFAKRMYTAVVNTYFKKREEHRMTYKSGGRCTQVDYILCRRVDLKEIEDCKVVAGESVVKQHRMVVCRMALEIKKRKRVRAEPRINWWKLKKEDCKVEFREEVREALGGSEELPDSWETTADVVRVTARRVLGVTFRMRKEEKETWRWNEEDTGEYTGEEDGKEEEG
ncbi:CFDP2 protein, partial [Polypterus senegalus]